MQPFSFLFALSVSATLAAPMDHRLEDIQCRCLSFSTDARPTLCTFMESHNLDWHTANSLASDYDLKIHFASQSAISKVLSIRRPLPDSVLQSISAGEARPIDPASLAQRENQLVCGFGDEVKHMDSHDRRLEPECHYVGYVGATFMLLLVLYLVAEYVWSRFFAEGTIKLEGDEKALMAGYDNTASNSSEQHGEKAAPADIS